MFHLEQQLGRWKFIGKLAGSPEPGVSINSQVVTVFSLVKIWLHYIQNKTPSYGDLNTQVFVLLSGLNVGIPELVWQLQNVSRDPGPFCLSNPTSLVHSFHCQGNLMVQNS